ncbi:MAG: hypothetical protein GWN21_17895, partial [Gammaproteobacteria bacterium]|nr:hypothetical protein [Gammaproteobacteria bacterium]NIV49645.1 hypothetical protein [Gammaproteobacteria bacterium]NIW57043.1 hypothetical protein [Gammaproteobacteria bacterium]
MVYRIPKPRPDAWQHLDLGVNELLDRLAALIPPPRRHRHRCLGKLSVKLWTRLRGAAQTPAGYRLYRDCHRASSVTGASRPIEKPHT